MATVSKLLLLLSLLFFVSYRSHIAHAGGGDAGSYKVLSIASQSLRTNKSVCSESKAAPSASGAATVPLHHRHGPCSPLPTKKMPTLEERLHRDQLRAAYIQRKFSHGAKNKKGGRGGAGGDVQVQQSHATTVPTTLGDALETLEYVITVRLGTPGRSQTMFIDTGSDVSWVRCKPCRQCHRQVDPLFDPSLSSTYSPFSCSSAECGQLFQQGYGNGCSSSGQCQFIVWYGDGSVGTAGTYSSDTLALASSTVVGKLRFGCSHAEVGMDGLTDGLMGLGGGAQSLVSQTAGTFGTASFSYCLPPTPSSSGFLALGAAAGTSSSSGFVKTPMLRSSQVPTFYFVRLEAIRVGGSQLSIPTSVFSGSAMVMDSGTVVTRLPRTAYAALSSAFRAEVTKRGYPPAPPTSDGFLDTCFDVSGQSSVSIPPVALVFSGGAVVDLDANGIVLQEGNSILCLAFAGNSDDTSLGIIGNVQQRTFEVLYDVGGGAVGFRAGAC